jgi:hypothetical protein
VDSTSLTSGLFVLAAFFISAAFAFDSALLRTFALLSAALLIALLTARVAIVLRISSRRMLARAFTGALFHTLISLSVVCHTVPPFCSMMRIGRIGKSVATKCFHQGACQNESPQICASKTRCVEKASIQTVHRSIKAKQLDV